jgi:acetate kinase
VAVGHRIAMGFTPTVPITDEVIHAIEGTKTVAPLHIPAMLTGIYAAQDIFGSDKLNVAAYDTSFHLTMPDKAYMYAIPYEYYEKYGLRRYGYHGTSHRYVSLRAAQLLGRKPEDLKIISCHLGNGSSIAAIEGGKSIDTSMGYTPLAGVMMGTRCGDIDPSLLHHIAKIDNLSIDEVYNLLNKKSGVLGVSGVSNDDRDVLEAAENGNKRAALACRMLRYQIKKYIGAYTAALGGLDAVIFTAGIGERSPELRAEVCENLEYLGIKINPEKNWSKAHSTEWEISTEDSRVKVWVIPTNEELMIARDAYQIYLDLKKR